MTNPQFSILFILGIGLFGGIAGAWFFQKIKVPQVLGYLVIGIVIGQSGLKLINSDIIDSLKHFNFFALGVIGFLVGGEIHGSTMKKYRKQFLAILLGEGILSSVLVTISIGLVLYLFTNNLTGSLAGGIVFGAIAAATDPASTMDVLWEYRSKGLLSTTIISIVALDDALAMTLYGIGTSIAQIIVGGNTSILEQVIKTSIELFGAIAMGGLAGVFMNIIIRYSSDKNRTMIFTIGTLLIVISLSLMLNIDVILTSMTLGIVITNKAPQRSKELFSLVKNFASPIYILFFVLVGARLTLGNMPGFLWIIVWLYVLFRSAGKMLGAWLGAKKTNADPVVQKYTGMALFAQGGVAIGLSMMASQHMGRIILTNGIDLGDIIITGIAASTFIVQIIGPTMVKIAIKLAKETGKNITEKDVITKWQVADVVDINVPMVKISDSVKKIITIFYESSYFCLPVVDLENRTVGMITMNDLKELLISQDTWEWVLARDILSTTLEPLTKTTSLEEAITTLRQLGREQLPVIESTENPVHVGILDTRVIRKLVNNKMVGI